MLEAIGETPLVRFHRIADGLTPAIYTKIEFVNPGGSVKDRLALAVVEAAGKQGLLQKGGAMVEATSGNTGVGLAMVAAVRRIPLYLRHARQDQCRENPPARGLRSRGGHDTGQRGEQLAGGLQRCGCSVGQLIPHAWQPNRFANLNNPKYHHRVTGPEIWRQTDGQLMAFVAGIGTRGTISGQGRFLKEENPNIKVVAAHPVGSRLSGDRPKRWDVEGIGEDHVPKTVSPQVVDQWSRVSDADSFTTARNLARREGLLVGGSCGTAMAAGLQRGFGDDWRRTEVPPRRPTRRPQGQDHGTGGRGARRG